MRDMIFGGTGLFVGGAVGIGATHALELRELGVVGLTVFVMTPAPVDDVVVEARGPRSGPAAAAPQAGPAGQVQLFTMAAVVPLVDGSTLLAFDGTSYVADLSAGTHRLQLLDMLGRESASVSFEVVAGERTQLRWSKKVMEDLGRVPMNGAAAPVVRRAPVAPVQADVEEVAAAVALAEADIAVAEEQVAQEVRKVEGALELIGDAANLLGGRRGEGAALPKLGRRLAK